MGSDATGGMRAVVVGGSLTGLLAARALSAHVPRGRPGRARPVPDRPGVAQGRATGAARARPPEAGRAHPRRVLPRHRRGPRAGRLVVRRHVARHPLALLRRLEGPLPQRHGDAVAEPGVPRMARALARRRDPERAARRRVRCRRPRRRRPRPRARRPARDRRESSRRPRRRRGRPRIAHAAVAAGGRLRRALRDRDPGARRIRQPLLPPPGAPARRLARAHDLSDAARHAARRALPGRGRPLAGDARRLVRRPPALRRRRVPRLRAQPRGARAATTPSATPRRCRPSRSTSSPPTGAGTTSSSRACPRGSPSSATPSAASIPSTARA